VTNNIYIVRATFERGEIVRRMESWKGRARNMRLAIRLASQSIMRRRHVKRYRHQRVTFTIEKAV
jgi:hypothetical protein